MNWQDKIRLHQPQEQREYIGVEQARINFAEKFGLIERQRPGLKIAKGTERGREAQ